VTRGPFPHISKRDSSKRDPIAFVFTILAFSALLVVFVLPADAGPGNEKSRNVSFTPLNLRQIEMQMLRLVNQDRTSPATLEETRGRALPLQWDERLADVARQHSEEMAANGYFSHQGLDGSSPVLRVTKAGIRWRAEGENIAKAADAAQAEAMFMDEPRFQENHRGNILNSNYNRVGIGIARAADGSIYITQEFAQIP
jgi:uncharacterized protein YkwD